MASYSRSFFTLKQDRQGYGNGGRTPSGRCILESRGENGKVSLFIQDLKPEIVYKVYLIYCNGSCSEGVSVGVISVDGKGKGEIKRPVNSGNVMNSGYALEEFNVVSIFVSGGQDLVAPVVGFKDEVVQWRANFQDVSGRQSLEPVLREKKDLDEGELQREIEEASTIESLEKDSTQEAKILVLPQEEEQRQSVFRQSDEGNDPENTAAEDLVLEGERPFKEKVQALQEEERVNVSEGETVKEIPSISDKEAPSSKQGESTEVEKNFFDEEMASDSKAQELTMPKEEERIDFHKEFQKMAKNFHKELAALEQFTFVPSAENSPKNVETEEYEGRNVGFSGYEDLLKRNIRMRPFKNQRTNVKWVRMSLKDLSLLPQNFWEYADHPLVLSSYQKYKHLILGVMEEGDQKRYIVGVPSVYEGPERHKAIRLGFDHFKCCDESKPVEGAYGYWLIQI